MRTGVRFRLTTPDHRPVYWSHNSGLLGSGSARLGLSQKDGLPFRCWDIIITAQGHRRAHSLCLSASVRTQEHLVISLVRNCPDYKILAVSSRNVLAKENPGRPADGRGSSLPMSDALFRRAIVARGWLAIGKEKPRPRWDDWGRRSRPAVRRAAEKKKKTADRGGFGALMAQAAPVIPLSFLPRGIGAACRG